MKKKSEAIKQELKEINEKATPSRFQLKRKIKSFEYDLTIIKKIPHAPIKKRYKGLEDEAQFIRQVPSHPRDRFKRKFSALERQIKFVGQVPLHPSNGLKRKLKEMEEGKLNLHHQERKVKSLIFK